MRKLTLVLALILVSGSSALAQSDARSYTADNFDFANAVRIELPPAKPTKPTKKGRRNGMGASTLSATDPASPFYASRVAMTVSRTLDGFTTGDAKVDSYIVESAARNGVDPVLIYATMHQESSFKPRAMSYKGARGLMQLMPGTAARFGVTNIWDPRQNIEGGARYMSFLLDMFDGDVALALAGYNAGEGAVMKYGRSVPPYRETQEYVRRISKRYTLMRDPQTALNAHSVSPAQVASVRNQSAPLTTYERQVFAVRLPDGRLQLLSQ
jgi:transglycosylase-like protein with SLT domain